MTISNLSAKTTHDLWIEARMFQVLISRPTDTTVRLDIMYPQNMKVVDGAVVLLHTNQLKAEEFPQDGEMYTSSLDYSAPTDRTGNQSGPVVVGMFSGIQGVPLPTDVLNPATGMYSTVVEISGTNKDTLYFASVHPCTNILQYYPIGITSYPLEGSHVDKGVESYTGSIPTATAPPISPVVGYVYFDTTLNILNCWSGDSWIQTTTEALRSGPVNPSSLGQVYFLNGTTPKGFDGTQWLDLNSTNLSFKSATSTWVPFVSFAGVLSLPKDPVAGTLVWDYNTESAVYFDGVTWKSPNATNTLLALATSVVPAFTQPAFIESTPLFVPSIGQLFYNTTTKQLNVWAGGIWQKANTDQEGSPSSDKTSIGTNGSYDERVRLINILKAQLGWPQTCVELKEEQFNISIDNALDNYRMWSDGAYQPRFFMFKLTNGQQTYFLNSPIDKTDRIVSISKIHRMNTLGIQSIGTEAIWTSGLMANYFSASTVDLLSISLLNNMSDEFERIFAGNLTFQWDEPARELFITRRISHDEKVIIEAMCEKTEQEIMVDRWSKQFIQNWAIAECKYMLGMIRTRFSSGTPGAGGSITQNGDLLIAEAGEEMTELKEACLANYEFGGHINGGNQSFLIG